MLATTWGLTIDFPTRLSGFVLSPISSKSVGSQDESLNITALAAAVVVGECESSGFEAEKVKGKIVLVSNAATSTTFLREETSAICLEKFGALGIVRATKLIRQPG